MELRDTDYLSSPMTLSTPHYILNKDLDHELVNFSAICKNNLHMFIEKCSKTNLIKAMKLDPVFIIPDDRKIFNAIEMQTKSDVSNIIEEELQILEKKWI